MQSSGETDSWIWREWLDVGPGGEAVDLGDMTGEFGKGKGDVVVGHVTGGRLRMISDERHPAPCLHPIKPDDLSNARR